MLIFDTKKNTTYCAFDVLYENKKGLSGKKKIFY
jgi:hypothetical protein